LVINLVGLEISIPTLIWTIINFFLLVFVLNKFLFKPTIRFMDERKARIDEGNKLKSDAHRDFVQEEDRVKQEINTVNSEAYDLIQKAKKDAEADMAAALKDARAKVADELECSKEKIRKEKDISGEELSAQMPEYVELLTNKLLNK